MDRRNDGASAPVRLPYRDLPTARLLLRRPRPDDASRVFASFGSDLEVTRFLTWKPHGAVADAEAALATRLDHLETETEYSWILEPVGSGEVVGLISLWPDPAGGEVGFVLARRHWKQGFATEALRAVTDWALECPEATCVWATCDVENAASARVLTKAGFAEGGELERRIVRPNLGPEPRPSLLFRVTRPAG